MATAMVRTAAVCAASPCSPHAVPTATFRTASRRPPVVSRDRRDNHHRRWRRCGGSGAIGRRRTGRTACRKYVSALEQRGDFPFEDFDPEHPDPAQLPAVGEWFAQSFSSAGDMTATIRAIEPATTQQQAQLDDFVAALQAEENNARARRARPLPGTWPASRPPSRRSGRWHRPGSMPPRASELRRVRLETRLRPNHHRHLRPGPKATGRLDPNLVRYPPGVPLSPPKPAMVLARGPTRREPVPWQALQGRVHPSSRVILAPPMTEARRPSNEKRPGQAKASLEWAIQDSNL